MHDKGCPKTGVPLRRLKATLFYAREKGHCFHQYNFLTFKVVVDVSK